MNSHHFIITGKVQSVFFRAKTKTRAEELGITGWVKNTDAGDVEVLAQGTEEQLAEFETWCRTGPSRARIDSFSLQKIDTEQFSEFTILK